MRKKRQKNRRMRMLIRIIKKYYYFFLFKEAIDFLKKYSSAGIVRPITILILGWLKNFKNMMKYGTSKKKKHKELVNALEILEEDHPDFSLEKAINFLEFASFMKEEGERITPIPKWFKNSKRGGKYGSTKRAQALSWM